MSHSKKPSFLPHLWRKNPFIFCAVGFGSGLLPKAPGTWGSLLGLIIYSIGLCYLSPLYYALMLLITFLFGIYCCDVATKAIGVNDHGSIVWDEFVGMWLTVFLSPPQWYWLIVGFIFFRLFDIYKPFPIKQFDQKLHGGFGIMFDDLIAGLYAFALLQGCAYLFIR